MMLASYHRWVFENNHLESVETLRDWIVQEVELQTIAAEKIKGITKNQKKKKKKKKKHSMVHAFKIRRLPVLDNAKYVIENMVYDHVKCFKRWISSLWILSSVKK